MRILRRLIGRLFALAASVSVVCIICTGPVHAYIDPGTGSYLLQVLAAGLFAAVFTIGVFWKKVKAGIASVFCRRKKD